MDECKFAIMLIKTHNYYCMINRMYFMKKNGTEQLSDLLWSKSPDC